MRRVDLLAGVGRNERLTDGSIGEREGEGRTQLSSSLKEEEEEEEEEEEKKEKEEIEEKGGEL